jgi:hypothetical protein
MQLHPGQPRPQELANPCPTSSKEWKIASITAGEEQPALRTKQLASHTVQNPGGSHKGTARVIHGGKGRCQEENIRERFRPNVEIVRVADKGEVQEGRERGQEEQGTRAGGVPG